MPEEDPSLPPDPALLNHQPKWFKRMFYGLIVVLALFISAIFLATLIIPKGDIRDEMKVRSNIRQIGLALLEFDSDYGSFPSDATVAKVAKSHPSHGFDLSGKSSNAMFRQSYAVEYNYSEEMFYAKVKNARRPDGVILPGNALGNGEVGFAYISGLSSKDDPNTPIVLTPLIPGTTKFDPSGFGREGNAVVLHIDNSVRSYKIEKDGRIYDNGIDLLSPKHPVWKGKKPDIRYPE